MLVRLWPCCVLVAISVLCANCAMLGRRQIVEDIFEQNLRHEWYSIIDKMKPLNPESLETSYKAHRAIATPVVDTEEKEKYILLVKQDIETLDSGNYHDNSNTSIKIFFGLFGDNTTNATVSSRDQEFLVDNGSSVALSCWVYGDYVAEVPDVHWLKDGNKTSDESITITVDRENSDGVDDIYLNLKIATFDAEKHSGNYECRVRRRDNVTIGANVRLSEGETYVYSNETATAETNHRRSIVVKFGFSRENAEWTNTKSVDQEFLIDKESSVGLDCKVSGDYVADGPEPDIHWRKDGNRITDSITITVDGDKYSSNLTIATFDAKMHTGDYECKVQGPDNTITGAKVRLFEETRSEGNYSSFFLRAYIYSYLNATDNSTLIYLPLDFDGSIAGTDKGRSDVGDESPNPTSLHDAVIIKETNKGWEFKVPQYVELSPMSHIRYYEWINRVNRIESKKEPNDNQGTNQGDSQPNETPARKTNVNIYPKGASLTSGRGGFRPGRRLVKLVDCGSQLMPFKANCLR